MMRQMLKIERGPEGEIVIRLRPPKILPAATKEHLWAVGKEILLAGRSLIDAAISRLEKVEKAEPKKEN